MFENLTDRLHRAFKRVTGQGRLKEAQVKEALKEVRKALLEADVALSVVKDFIHHVQEKAIGKEINHALSSDQGLIKIVHDELKLLLGEKSEGLHLKAVPPVVILVAGLQGAGKTTTCSKLAKHLQTVHQKSVALVSTDIYRPAAIEQLSVLATSIQAFFIRSEPQESPIKIVERALLEARKNQQDVLIIDTAGRLHVDENMMQEIKAVANSANPTEILFVADGMTGQDAVQSAKAFSLALPLSGVILTKMDGDARGGSALSIRQVTGKPIKFIGVGEKIEGLEVFHPDRIASRILGMGDVLTLIEEVERQSDKEKVEKLNKKLQKGEGFDLNDLRDQMKQMLKMGGMGSLMDKLPGMGQLSSAVKAKANDKELIRTIAILDSMTSFERRSPLKIAASGARKRRIALGSGTNIQQVNRVLKQHEQMQKMMKKASTKGGMQNLVRGLQGKMPGGFTNF